MHGVFPYRDPLRLERFVEIIPAELRPGVSQETLYEPAQTRRVADIVALHDGSLLTPVPVRGIIPHDSQVSPSRPQAIV